MRTTHAVIVAPLVRIVLNAAIGATFLCGEAPGAIVRMVVDVTGYAVRQFARTKCSLLGGLTVTGEWSSPGGAVLLANRVPRSPTAMLSAALPVRARPAFDPANSERALAAGRTVVVLSDDGRATDDALALAKDSDVPVVPVALLVGDAKRRLSPPPREVRFGEPVDPAATDAAALQREVLALCDEHPVRVRQSRVWTWVAGLIAGPYSMLIAFLWGFAEAISWFIVAEMALILMPAAVPRKVMPWAAFLIPGSVLGVVFTAWLASRGVTLPAPLTTPRMAQTAFDQLAAGPSAMMNQALSGIPVKVYGRAAGEHGIGLGSLAGWTLLERGLRISTVALVVWGLSYLLHPWLRRLYGVYLIVVAVVFTVLLSTVIAAWS